MDANLAYLLQEQARRRPRGRALIECAARRYTQVKRAAFVAERGLRLLVVELYGSVIDDLPKRLMRELEWAHVDEVRVLRHLPVDKRHNAKIDYGALRRMLN